MQASRLDLFTLKGSSWIKGTECGCMKKNLRWTFSGLQALAIKLQEENILMFPVENFRRFDEASKLVTLSTALALHDADFPYAKDKKQDIGILGTGQEGALISNLAYFRDYIDSGRKMGRGNLFIYTLASSPLAEAAIHFGFQGPLSYIGNAGNPGGNFLAQEAVIARNKTVKGLLAVTFNSQEAACSFKSREME